MREALPGELGELGGGELDEAEDLLRGGEGADDAVAADVDDAVGIAWECVEQGAVVLRLVAEDMGLFGYLVMDAWLSVMIEEMKRWVHDGGAYCVCESGKEDAGCKRPETR